MIEITPEQFTRFWQKVNKSDDPDQCWEWIASTDKFGYGQFRVGNKIIGSHCVSWEIHNGKIPNRLCVLHSCDNPKCINPKHLFLGTRADNNRDMVAKGRNIILKGEKHGNAKLTDESVIEIRKRYKKYSKDNNIYTLGKEFNVHPTLIAYVVKHINWKHIKD